MQGSLVALTLVLLLGTVLTGMILLRRTGTRALPFGNLDTTDCLLPPFALVSCYAVVAAAFNLPLVSIQQFFPSDVIAWSGSSCTWQA
jgi:UPF0716 family protein affecting phage T7 exclusion